MSQLPLPGCDLEWANLSLPGLSWLSMTWGLHAQGFTEMMSMKQFLTVSSQQSALPKCYVYYCCDCLPAMLWELLVTAQTHMGPVHTRYVGGQLYQMGEE